MNVDIGISTHRLDEYLPNLAHSSLTTSMHEDVCNDVMIYRRSHVITDVKLTFQESMKMSLFTVYVSKKSQMEKQCSEH